MTDQERNPDDPVPHLVDLLLAIAVCRRRLADAQTEVRPFGPNFRAIGETTAAIDALARRLTGQRDFFGPPDPRDASVPLHFASYVTPSQSYPSGGRAPGPRQNCGMMEEPKVS